MQIQWIFIYLGLGAILLELILGVATGFDLMLFGIALICGGAIGNIFNSYQASFVTAIIFTCLYMFFGRKFIKSKLSINTKNTNVDNLMGKTGICIKEIELHKAGQVKIGAEIWRAESESKIEVGSKIKVVAIEGASVKVTKI